MEKKPIDDLYKYQENTIVQNKAIFKRVPTPSYMRHTDTFRIRNNISPTQHSPLKLEPSLKIDDVENIETAQTEIMTQSIIEQPTKSPSI